jgi:hypothetical protein
MQFSLTQSLNNNRLWVGAVLVSLAVNLLRVPLLHGTFAALVGAVGLQLYLPGYLLARALGKNRHPHPIVRFAWVLVCGLALTICLGIPARLLSLPIPAYLIALHLVMLVLALLPTPAPTQETPWKLTRSTIPLYVLVAVCCVVALGVGYESRERFYGFEDQPIFISLVDWMAHHPGELPNDLPLRSRQIGVLNGDSRFDTDGFSYNQAAWVWTSGVTGAQLIWYDLGALFLWASPLLIFALAYEVTQRERAAAWSAVALVIVGLLTLDNLVYNPIYTAFGRFALFQINTLRQASITFMLPLTLMAALSYLRTYERRTLVIVALAGLALAAMHPIQAMIFLMSIGVTLLIRWLAQPGRAALLRLLPLVVALTFALLLPAIQRVNRVSTDTLIRQSALQDESVTSTGLFLVLRDLPVLGTTFIRDPANVFYHPVIPIAVILGLAYGWWWQRGLAAAYIFGTTLLALLIFFTPGLTELFNKFATSVGLLTASFMIPIPLIYGLTVDKLLAVSSQRSAQNQAERPATPAQQNPIPQLATGNWQLQALLALITLGIMALLLFEPIPIVRSARDQLTAYNAMQSLRLLRPSQVALGESLRQHLTPGEIAVLVTPYEEANVVIEESPDTLITGGRDNRNLAYPGNLRFFTEGETVEPWLDTADLSFLGEFGATHILTLADTTRLPQLLLQPERFTLLDTPAGYALFRVEPAIQPDALDELYAQMNARYAETVNPRWGRGGFNLILPGDPAWREIAGEWAQRLDAAPDDDRARLGLAFAYALAGDDEAALPLWQDLYTRHPDVPLYADALASTLQAIAPSQDTIAPLLATLDSPLSGTRAAAARRLLTGTFFYRLSDEQLDKVIGITEADAAAWDRLSDDYEGIRNRAALVMDRGRWQTARTWLDALPAPERAPQDLTAAAAAALAMGDLDGALAILRPAADDDRIAANRFLHPDRWADNTAASMYAALSREPLSDEAVAPQAILQNGAVYVISPQVTRLTDETTLTITATYGSYRPYRAYPIRDWRIQVISPDSATTYAEVDVEADFGNSPLVRRTTSLTLPPDLPELTPALVVIQPRYDNAVTTTPVILPLVLNRPEGAVIPADATETGYRFGDHITLEAYEGTFEDGVLQLDLYWQTTAPLPEDYQVFVHVVDASGVQVGGGDSAPVNNRYPTSQWRDNITIHDPRTISFSEPLPPGDYTVRVGLYRLSDGARLPISPIDAQVQDNSAALYTFSVE